MQAFVDSTGQASLLATSTLSLTILHRALDLLFSAGDTGFERSVQSFGKAAYDLPVIFRVILPSPSAKAIWGVTSGLVMIEIGVEGCEVLCRYCRGLASVADG